jgi:hypothetical protein
MKYPTRIYYTETDKAMMWDRWQNRRYTSAAAKAFATSTDTVRTRRDIS